MDRRLRGMGRAHRLPEYFELQIRKQTYNRHAAEFLANVREAAAKKGYDNTKANK
jgi:hypothetical protein